MAVYLPRQLRLDAYLLNLLLIQMDTHAHSFLSAAVGLKRMKCAADF